MKPKSFPSVMAKTRICVGLDSSLNNPSAPTATWLRKLRSKRGYMAADLLDDMPLAEWSKGKPRARPPVPSDRDWIKRGVLGVDDDGPWWDAESHEITTEAMARAIWLLTHDVNGRRKKRRRISWWWSCPATFTFRCFFLDSPEELTAIFSTPPPPSRQHHWESYVEWREDQRLLPDPNRKITAAPSHEEPVLIVSSEARAERFARLGRRKVPIAKEIPLLTPKTPNTLTMRPLSHN